MTKLLHVFLHIVAVALQVVNIAAIPTPYQPVVAIAVSTLQGLLAAYNHTAVAAPAIAPTK